MDMKLHRLHRHRRKKKNRIRQKCGDCELRFHSKFCMLLHLKFHRRSSQGWFHCDVCKKRFQKLANFIKHRNRHPTREKSKVSKPLTVNNRIIEPQLNFKDESGSVNDAKDFFPSNEAVNEQQNGPENSNQIKGETDNETVKVSTALKFIEQLRALLKLNRGTDEEFDDFKDGSLQDSKVSSSSNTADDALPDAILSCSAEPTDQCLLGIENCKDKTSHLIGSHIGKDSVIISSLRDSHLQLDKKSVAEMPLNNISPERSKTHSAEKPTVSAKVSKEEAIPKRIYTCSTCKASFISYSKLRRHKRILHKIAHNLSNSVSGKAHSTVDMQQSSFTSTVKSSSCNVKSNQATSHNHQCHKHQCTFCLQKLSSFNSLARHMREVHKCKQKVAKNVLQYQKSCDGVMFSGQDVTELATNCIKPSFFGSRDGEGLLKCSLCDASFLTFIGQKRHLQFKHNIGFDAKVKKNSSKKYFTSKQESSYVDDKIPKSKIAENGYETDENITCKKCESNFVSVKERRLHALQSHGLEVSFEGEKFMFLELQIKSVDKSSHNAQRRPLLDNGEKFYRKADNSCKLCFAKYNSFNSLQKHMSRKHKVKIYKQSNLLRSNKRTRLSTDSKKSVVCLQGKNQIIAKCSLDKKEKKLLDKKPNDSMDNSSKPLPKSLIKENDAIRCGEGNDNQEISKNIEKSTPKKRKASKTQAEFVANEGRSGDIFEGIANKVDPLWRVDFQRKQFSCKICDASFSGFFIQKKHMLMTHGIPLDAQGRRVEQDSKTVHSIDKSASKPDRNAPSSSSLFRSDTMPSGNLNTEEDSPCLSPATAMNMSYVRNSNQKFDCPHCPKEFGNLIDRHIHVIDNHGRMKERSVDRQSNLDEHAEPTVAMSDNDVDSQTKKPAPVKSCESSKTENKTGSENIKKPRGTGEFKCPLCEKRYAHKKGRMRHMKTVHVSSSAFTNSNVAAEGDLSSAEDQLNEKQHEYSNDVRFRQMFSESKVISNLRAITVLDSDMDDNAFSDGVTEDGMNNDEGKTKRCFSPVPPCEENDLLEKNVFSQLNASLRLQEFGLHSACTKDKTGNPKENDPSFEDVNRFVEDTRKDDQMGRYEMKFDQSERHLPGSKPNSNLDVITVDTTEDEDDVIDIINLDDTNFDGIEPEENNEQEAAYMASDFESSELKCSGSNAEQSNTDDMQQQRLSSRHITGYSCSIPGCSKSFSSKRSYQRHYSDTCKLCHKKMKCRSSVKRHLLEVHKIANVLSCDMCSEFFPEPISLAFHNKEMHISEMSMESF